MKKADANPMQRAHDAPRCHAKAKRTGNACRAPAVRGWKVCRMHGARGGAQPGPANANWRHGGRSREAVALRKAVNDLLRANRRMRNALTD